MAKTLPQFYQDFREEVLMTAEENTSGWEMEDFLTSLMLEYLEDTGEVTDPIMCPFRDRGLQLNGYSISEDGSSADIYVSLWVDSETPKSVSQTEIDAAIKRGVHLFQNAVNDLYKAFEKDSDTYEFAISLHQQKDTLKSIRVLALTNGLVKPIEFKSISIEGADITFGIWDIERLYRCVSSGKMRETIHIDFEEKYGITIPCIENCTSSKYSVYLAIIGGDLLAQLYAEYHDRLLEKNVRSYLQAKGAVNKGIRDTLQERPDMFLAFNNGISVTAEAIGIVRDSNGRPSIKSISDMQIVNGGQTTASIFTATKDKKKPVDLSQVFVQMKISVVSDSADMDAIVPEISKYANTQNKVQTADFSANDPYHRTLEALSRTIWAPAVNGAKPVNWFYERARGQYADALSGESTTLRRNQYKATHPCFTKTDIAKYEMTWDQMPYHVSEGAQKNFQKFTILLDERKIKPDESYYHALIAKAIMFRRTEKLIADQKYGGYRANIVTYTLSYLSNKTAQRIDLERIWREQALTPALEKAIIEVSRFVHDLIVNAPSGANIGEWCKKPKCWDTIREYDYQIPNELTSELISVARTTTARTEPVSSIHSVTADEQKLIDEAADISAAVWYALSKWSKETQNFQAWQRGIIFSVGTIVSRGKKPSVKQAKQAMLVYQEAIKKGFIPQPN